MTAYSGISAGEIDADSPVTTTLMTKLRDNPIAMAEGDASAPDIAHIALGDYATGTVAIGAPIGGTTSSGSLSKVVEWQVARGGTVSCKFTGGGTGGSREFRIYVNGSAVGTLRSGAGTWTEDVGSLAAGDLVQIYARDASVSGTAVVSDAYLMVAASGAGATRRIGTLETL